MPCDAKLFPTIQFTAIFAIGSPVAFDTKGTVLEALGLASILLPTLRESVRAIENFLAAEDLVRGVDLHELLLRDFLLVRVLVRVPDHGLLPKGALELLVVGAALHPQDLARSAIFWKLSGVFGPLCVVTCLLVVPLCQSP